MLQARERLFEVEGLPEVRQIEGFVERSIDNDPQPQKNR